MGKNNLEILRQLAQHAIDCADQNPSVKKFNLVPAVQVYCFQPLADFPVRYSYVGINGSGCYVYNLDAREVVSVVTRLQLEANLALTIENPH